MTWIENPIEGVQVREVRMHSDERGWLAELFRSDALPPGLRPAMCYVSVTRPGAVRGPHEHAEQTDFFAFVGPGNLLLKLWDPRPTSPTRGHCMTLNVGRDRPRLVVIPPGIVHGYANRSHADAWILNFPNRLFAGRRRAQPVDEIRYENMPDSPYRMP